MVPVIIILLITGLVLVLASFIFRDSLSSGDNNRVITEEQIERLVESRFQEVKYQLDDEAEKSADMIKDQTERELEKLSNEKIMAVNEYSDQVMDQINKNHDEVMFLYSMLSDKQKELDQAVEQLSRIKRQSDQEERIARTKKGKAKTVSSLPDTAPQKAQKKPNPVSKPQEPSKPSEPSKERYSNKEKILNMHKEGKSALEIAQSLNLGIGEVRLVIELNRER